MDVNTLYHLPPWDWPADAAATILDALEDAGLDTGARTVAAELAASVTVMNDDMAEALMAIVRRPGEDETLRSTAAISLGPILEEMELMFFDEPDAPLSERVVGAIQHCLREVYLDAEASKIVRRRALEAAVRAEDEWHTAAVRAAYHSGDHDWKTTAVFCMSYVGGFDHEIVEALDGDDPDILFEAVRAAGGWGPDGAWPRLADLVRRPGIDKPTLLAAVDALASIRPDEAHEALGHLLDTGDEDIEEAVLEALATADVEAGHRDPFNDDPFDDVTPLRGPDGNGGSES